MCLGEKPTAVEAGLEMLLKQLPDLVIDVPRVEDYVVPLLAHFVEDGHVQEDAGGEGACVQEDRRLLLAAAVAAAQPAAVGAREHKRGGRAERDGRGEEQQRRERLAITISAVQVADD